MCSVCHGVKSFHFAKRASGFLVKALSGEAGGKWNGISGGMNERRSLAPSVLATISAGISQGSLAGPFRRACDEDLANAWAYVRSHDDEISRQIAENEAD